MATFPLLLCVESAIDTTETYALVDNIQASPKDILIQLGIHFPLTMECAIGLTVGDALQMLLLLFENNTTNMNSSWKPNRDGRTDGQAECNAQCGLVVN